MNENLQKRKKKIIEQIGQEDELKKLKKVKLLKLMEFEIQQMLEFWSLGQVLEILNSELGFKISKTVFYEFCAKNLKKDEKSEPIKKDKKSDVGLSQKRDTKKEEIATLDEDELSAVAMFNNKKY
ncbi:hypothetical protein ACN2CX_07930 [Aliarcobacter butzleri]|uniref:hypothetical protein n=1 Tax=Aliarcobacter butzleri TaxID=28197 RepID=UPI001EDDA58A|nr:hypothetical protein [Aliarcobacter butzleri]MCG3704315.1 hypothetical protein [Aliarcobacter butzleri]